MIHRLLDVLDFRSGGGSKLVTSIACVIVATSSAAATNRIAIENALSGNPKTEWDVTGAGDLTIQGFAADISFSPGQVVNFKVNTNAASYRIDIYRLGYYGGLGARRLTTIFPSAQLPQSQPSCLRDDPWTGLVDCGNWGVSASWTVPADAVSGVHVARLVRPATNGASHIIFVVRDDSGGSELLVQTSDATWQAYNEYGGCDFYPGTNCSTPLPHPDKAYRVSYNRPVTTRQEHPTDSFFNAEYPMLRWLEANGYDVSYTTSVDTERRGSAIVGHRAFFSVGHDEYVSGQMRASLESARAAGVNLAFFSGNEIYWKTRWESSIDGTGTSDRTLVCYKEGAIGLSENSCGVKCDPSSEWTGLWRDGCDYHPPTDGCRPENALSGQISWWHSTFPIVVPAAFANMRFWRNTSIATFPTLPDGTLGYEWDASGGRPDNTYGYDSSYPACRVVLSSTTPLGSSGPAHHLSLYRHGSGALVFGAGTVQWSWGLDATHDAGEGHGQPADARMQQATVNLLAEMGAQPTTLQSGLVSVARTGDSSPPVTTINYPLSGSSLPAGVPVSISGTAADVGGGVVSGVEVSVDGGVTWAAASGTNNWTFSWTPGAPGSITLKSRSMDDLANCETSASGTLVTVTPSASSCAQVLFSGAPSPPPMLGIDSRGTEVGVKFRSDVDGYVLGVRFYKPGGATGAHAGNLWTRDGLLLATANFANETASGWQEVSFSSPIPITAGDVYVASYHIQPNAGYAQSAVNYFTNAGIDNPPLHALRDGFDGPNGVYVYDLPAGAGGFPTQSAQGTNWYADVLFSPSITLFSGAPSPTPSLSIDSRGTEVGVKFRSDVDGYVLGVRFYKPGGATGAHVGHLWTRGGTLLATANFANETASGWQAVSFSSPVPITASDVYVASYHIQPNAGYAQSAFNYFTNAGIDSPPLHALRDGLDGPDGVYVYDPPAGPGGFPTQGAQGTNWYADVLFSSCQPAAPDNTPPTISSVTPAGGSTGVEVAESIVVIFNEAMDPTTVNGSTIELRDPSNQLVAATVTYDGNLRKATLNPRGPLVPNTAYAAKVKGGPTNPRVKDLAGNPLSYDYVWSFTTHDFFSCPCTIWSDVVTPQTPHAVDSNQVEVGVKFRVDFSGQVFGVRFFKGPQNNGPHVARLWKDGALLAEATFTNETPEGWQQVIFAQPIAIQPATTYVASYHTATGYAQDVGYFLGSGVDRPPLHALADQVDGVDGVYSYGPPRGAGGFPTAGYYGSNYYVDVVFDIVGGCTTDAECDDGNPCTDDACDLVPPACVHLGDDTNPCSDANSCTEPDRCVGGMCMGGPPLNCDDHNSCTDDFCDPAVGCAHTNNTASCVDGNGCTANDTCSGGLCSGTPIVAPGVVATMTVNSGVVSWTAVSGFEVVYDVPRGRRGELPVGSGAHETCLTPGGTSALTINDTDPVPVNDTYWYLVRARNSCGNGGYGNDSNGVPRLTAVCP